MQRRMQETHSADQVNHHSPLQQKLLVSLALGLMYFLQQKGEEGHPAAGYPNAITREMQLLCNIVQ